VAWLSGFFGTLALLSAASQNLVGPSTNLVRRHTSRSRTSPVVTSERGYASAVGSELPVAACPRRRLHAARPTKAAPVPKSSKVAGSGTGA
jgi:hypothetical protein